jgi:hemerythrin
MTDGAWVPGMSVGVAALDDAHKIFFARLAEIAEALDAHSFDDAERLCRSLLDLGAQHAAEEEAFLRRLGYPHVVAVIAAQQGVLQRCERLLALIGEKSPAARAFADTLKDALIACLLRSDINFKSFVQEMRDLGRFT